MFCYSCRNTSLSILCKTCKELIAINKTKRYLDNRLKVYSFYSYDEHIRLSHSKYEPIGTKILSHLAKQAFISIKEELSLFKNISGICIDGEIGDYSHTAVILKELESFGINPIYSVLKAKSNVKYAGKSLFFRQSNKKKFEYKSNAKIQEVILVDDIITSGTTLLEAENVLKKHNINVLFCLALFDAKQV